MSILQEPIKKELNLSDTQLGALTGLAFGLFYATLAIPIAVWADRTVRVNVVLVALTLWSVMTAACGFAHGFIMLLLFRIGVAVGEAGGVSPVVSLLSDYFPQSNRATAMAIFGVGAPTGIGIGMLAGGWINDAWGWRYAFVIAGLTGVLLVPIIFFTVRELPRGFADREAGISVPRFDKTPSFREALSELLVLRSFRHLLLAGAAHSFATYSVINWNPSFYVRVHDMSTSEVGFSLALVAGGFGILGTLTGGILADRLAVKDPRWYMIVPGVAMIAFVPAAYVQYMLVNPYASFAVAAIPYFLSVVYIGPFIATSQSLARPEIRSMANAIVMLVFNIVGLSFGPVLAGLISDLLAANYGLGKDSLRYALMIMVTFNLWSGYHFIRGSQFLKDELNRNQ